MFYCGQRDSLLWNDYLQNVNRVSLDDVLEKLIFVGFRLQYCLGYNHLFSFVMETMTQWALTTRVEKKFCKDHIIFILPLACYHSMSSVPDVNIIKKLFDILVECAELNSKNDVTTDFVSRNDIRTKYSEILFHLMEKLLLKNQKADATLAYVFLSSIYGLTSSSSTFHFLNFSF